MRCVLAILCPMFAAALQLQSSQAPMWLEVHTRDFCPSMFVYVFSTLDSFERRAAIREMWQHAYLHYPSPMKYTFGLCTRAGVSEQLREEQRTYGDLAWMDCEEGYLDGILTRKVAASMNHFLNTEMAYSLFMKIDDDTFISTDRLCGFMSHQISNEGVDLNRSYLGVFIEGEENWRGRTVIRDPVSPWYEPYEKYDQERYPLAAKGGPGYILSRPMVQELVDRAIPSLYELNNEDKAVGYWVSLLHDIDSIRYVNIPGTDGYDEHKETIVTTGKFRDYPNIMHHHLDGNTIQCMYKVEFSDDPDSATIDHCLASPSEALWTVRHKEYVRIHMP